jgi:hypothetical protein
MPRLSQLSRDTTGYSTSIENKSDCPRSILVFGVGAVVEIAQFFGVPIFGRTFDPVDFVMYGIGVILAAILDTTVFPRVFDFWALEADEST